jgi:hypothetical protein
MRRLRSEALIRMPHARSIVTLQMLDCWGFGLLVNYQPNHPARATDSLLPLSAVAIMSSFSFCIMPKALPLILLLPNSAGDL